MSALILQPIDDSIVGKDFKYDDSFLSIEQEIDKSHSATFDGSTDWEFVLNSTHDFLINKSKDLKIATWWIYSCWKKNSFLGLEQNLINYLKFLEQFNENLYPKSNKAKQNIIFWFEETLSKEIEQDKAFEFINSKIFFELFNSLNTTLNTFLNTEEFYFKKIINHLKKRVEEQEKKEEEQEKVEEKKLNEDELDSVKAVSFLRQLKQDASKLALYYRKNDISDLKALRINRFLSWLETDGIPLNEKGVTQLNPPLELELDEVKELYNNKQYDEAVLLIEEIIEVCPFWFDGHFYLYNIFNASNNKNRAIEVKNTLLSFIKTNEGILTLKFKDNSNFASTKTRKWIEEELTQSKINTTTSNNDSFEFDETLSFKEAMEQIQSKYSTSETIKDRFFYRLKQMELAVENNKESMALALFDELETYIEKFNLINWDKKLVSEVYTLFLSSFNSVQVEPEKIEKYYSSLCQIDINSALKINI